MEATPSDRASLLIAVAASSGAFAIGFNLGAFGVVFFDRLLAIWVVASIVLLASFVTDLPPRRWPGRLVLAVPSLWMVLALLSDPAGEDAASQLVFAVTLVVTLVTLPFIAWSLLSALKPDVLDLPRRHRIALAGAVVGFALVGLGIGARNDLLLTCDDFKLSGNDLPANCVSGPRTPNPGE